VLVTEALADTRVVIICEGKSMTRRRVLVLVAGAAAVWGAGPVAVPGTAVAWAVPAARGPVAAAGSWGRAIEVPGLGALNKGGFASVNSVSCASAGSSGAGADGIQNRSFCVDPLREPADSCGPRSYWPATGSRRFDASPNSRRASVCEPLITSASVGSRPGTPPAEEQPGSHVPKA